MAEKVTREEFERVRELNRHNDLMTVMKNLTASLENHKSINKLDSIVNYNASVLEKFCISMDKLEKRLATPQKIENRVQHAYDEIEIDFSEVISSLSSVASELMKLRKELDSKAQVKELVVKRNTFGRIHSVEVIRK